MTDKEARNPQMEDMGILAAAMAALGSAISIQSIGEQANPFMKELGRYSPVKTAATFGALLTQKRLQPNCLRLEALVHLSIAVGEGRRAPLQQLLVQGYAAVGKACGQLEDPPEDVFVGNIYSKRGNYRVLEGIWESGTFYLQRFVNLVDGLPDEGQFRAISDTVHALLRLSDLVCERAGLTRNEVGSSTGESQLPARLAAKSDQLRRFVRFDLNELGQLGIEIGHLSPFVFDPVGRDRLLDQSISNTDLEACPIAIEGGDLYLVLPTAVSIAIRRYFITVLGLGDNREVFVHQLGKEYSRLFDSSRFLGQGGHRLPFIQSPWGSICVMSKEVDKGRYLNALFFLDVLEDFVEEGFSGVFRGNERLREELRKASRAMQERASTEPGFRDGFTLVVGCGVGRGVVLEDFLEPRKGWQWEFISAPDLIVLSQVKGMEPLNLWRISRMQNMLEKRGVWLQNMNGLLNLYAWAESLEGHLVPHSQVPEDLAVEGFSLYMEITQNALLDVRRQVALSVDQHVQLFVDGSWKKLFKEGDSYFAEDDRRPLYVHMDTGARRRLLGARVTSSRCWWYEATSLNSNVSPLTYERWKMLGTWMARAADVLDSQYSNSLDSGPILWRCVFEGDRNPAEITELGTASDLLGAIKTSLDASARTIELVVGEGFDRAIFHPHNIAETALVRAFVEGVMELAGTQADATDKLVGEVVPDVHARHSHVFSAQTFRDHFHTEFDPSPVTISKLDDAAMKLGLGWRARDPKEGGAIQGKQQCLDFLHTLVRQLQRELCSHLKSFRRTDLLTKLLLNYEVASKSRDRWHRTAAAVLALRDDKASAMKAMAHHEFKLNGVLQPTRNLIEMALCESPEDEGFSPGDLDIAMLLVQSAQIFHLGGWADLIHWDLLEPELIIRPLGDVHAHHGFMDTVMESFGSASSEHRYKSSVRRYARNFEQVSTLDSSDQVGADEFVSAWQEEFGVHLDAFRRFVDALENHGIESQQIVFTLPRSALLAMADDTPSGDKIIDSMKLGSRQGWLELPHGYTVKDVAPWRFRRRLSVLRRPLIQFGDGDDPLFLIAPGLVREGFAAAVGNYFDGSYPDVHLGQAMRGYVGYARRRDGKEFNEKVAARMTELGWSVLPEVQITKIIGKALDRNYGDVDVLAWDPGSGRVLIIECKDLQFRKTYGEIAEQLSDYRGIVSADGKVRDSLRKHLDRIGVLRAHVAQLQRFVQLQVPCTIESHLVFSHPVPMMFATGPIREQAATRTFDQLDELKIVLV